MMEEFCSGLRPRRPSVGETPAATKPEDHRSKRKNALVSAHALRGVAEKKGDIPVFHLEFPPVRGIDWSI